MKFILLLLLLIPLENIGQTLPISNMFVLGENQGTIEYTNIEQDVNNNWLISGIISGTVDVDPGPNEVLKSAFYSGGYSSESFIQKINQNGEYVWMKQFGPSTTPISLAADDFGNTYLSGYFYATQDFDPNGGFFELTSSGFSDVFIVKLNENGFFEWAKSYGSSSAHDKFSQVISDGTNSYLRYSNKLVKLNASGMEVWNLEFETTNYCGLNTMNITSAGNIIVAGMFSDSVDLNPDVFEENWIHATTNSTFLVELNADGEFIKYKTLNFNSTETNGFSVTNIELDDFDNVYLAGNFKNKVNVSTSNIPIWIEYSSNGDWSNFLIKLNENLENEWHHVADATNSPTSKIGLAIDAFNHPVISTCFKGIMKLNPTDAGYIGYPAYQLKFYIRSFDENGNFVYGNWGTSEAGSIGMNDLSLKNDMHPVIVGWHSGLTNFDSGNASGSFLGDSDNLAAFFIEYSAQEFLATSDLPFTETIKLYPNPTNENLVIEFENTGVKEICVLDLSGKLISTRTVNESSKFHLNLAEYSPGMYLIQITSNGIQSNYKVIKN